VKNSTGIVMQLEKRHAFIMTNTGEFLKVKVGKQSPSIGEVYSGEIAKKVPIYKYASMAASLLFVLFFGGVSYAYYTPVASVEVNINPSIELQVNRWDRIIKSIPLNDDGVTVLSSLDIKNKPLNVGLDLIVEEAKKDNFINESYIESGKVITVSVKENKLEKEINLSSFQEHAKKDNLTVEIKKSTAEFKENPAKNNDKTTPSDDSQDNTSNANDKKEPSKNGNGIDKNAEDKGNGNSDNKNNGNSKSSNSNNNGSSNSNNSNKEDKSKDDSKKPDNKNSDTSNLNNNSQGKKDEIETTNSQEDKKDHPNNKDKEKENTKPKK
jgi:hypothetical protein